MNGTRNHANRKSLGTGAASPSQLQPLRVSVEKILLNAWNSGIGAINWAIRTREFLSSYAASNNPDKRRHVSAQIYLDTSRYLAGILMKNLSIGPTPSEVLLSYLRHALATSLISPHVFFPSLFELRELLFRKPELFRECLQLVKLFVPNLELFDYNEIEKQFRDANSSSNNDLPTFGDNYIVLTAQTFNQVGTHTTRIHNSSKSEGGSYNEDADSGPWQDIQKQTDIVHVFIQTAQLLLSGIDNVLVEQAKKSVHGDDVQMKPTKQGKPGSALVARGGNFMGGILNNPMDDSLLNLSKLADTSNRDYFDFNLYVDNGRLCVELLTNLFTHQKSKIILMLVQKDYPAQWESFMKLRDTVQRNYEVAVSRHQQFQQPTRGGEGAQLLVQAADSEFSVLHLNPFYHSLNYLFKVIKSFTVYVNQLDEWTGDGDPDVSAVSLSDGKTWLSLRFFVEDEMSTNNILRNGDDGRLDALRRIKRLSMHQFYFELWAAALQALHSCQSRHAESLRVSAGNSNNNDANNPATINATINREYLRQQMILRRSYLLVKIPLYMKETKDKYQMERSSDFNCVENSIRLLSNFPMLYTLSNGENMLQRIVEVCLFHRIISYESLQKLLSPQVYASLLSSSKVIADWPNMEGESTPVLSTDNIESAFDPKANRMWTDADVDIYNQWVNKEGVGLDELRRLIEETCATLLGTQFFVQTHLLDLIVEDFFSAPRYTEKLEFLLSGILNNPSVLDIFHLHGEIHHIIKLLLKMARQYLLDADSKQKNGYSGLDDAGVLKSHRQFGYIFSVLYLIIHRFEVLHNDTNQRVFIEDLNNASKELGDTKTSSFALLLEWFYEEYIHRSASATQQQPTDRHKEIGVDLISVLYKAYCDKASDLPVSSSSITADKIDLQSNVLASVLRKYTPTEILGATPYIVRQCFAAYFESKLTDQGTLLSMLASLCTECGKHVELCVVKTLCSYQKYEFNKEAASESERVLFLLFAVLQRHEPQQRVTNHLTASMLGALLRSDSPAATEHRGLIQSSESLLSRKPASLLPAIKNKGSAAHRALTSIRLVFSHNFGQFLNPHAHPSLFTSYMLTHSLISLKEVFVLIGQEQFIELVLQASSIHSGQHARRRRRRRSCHLMH
eukprot:GEZU01023901.1.p1 GENE.GEZU01023901.1~~GEZU01023901.1.p1  ORF type:complete len:1131 (+),score=154.13 GEZU01023901.1:93-3485(+)